MLQASQRAAWFVIEHGGLDARIADIAAAIDLNERTFYRYFPTKPDALRPLFDWGAALLADRLVERADLEVKDAVLLAFGEVVAGEHAERTRKLFPLVFADPALRAVLLAVYHDAEEELRAALASRWSADAESPAVHVAAAAIVMVTRLALELMATAGTDPLDNLRACLELLPDHLVLESLPGRPAGKPTP